MSLDSVSDLPNEISQIIFSDLSIATLLNCRKVSKSWKQITANDGIWKSKFQDQKYWKYYNDDSETDSWYELYKERYLLELNWKNGKFSTRELNCYSTVTCCVFFKNWIITGSTEFTINIWDNETFQCLRTLGKSSSEISRENLSDSELLELANDIDNILPFGAINCMDINDEYLISGSIDSSCIIWKLPDFKPIQRLVPPAEEPGLPINYVRLYNDYIVGCNDEFISVWKSSLDNLEDQPPLNLQHSLVVKGRLNDVCIHNDIIYCTTKYGSVIRSWYIETGQMIQEFRNKEAASITANDQYLFVSDYNKITVLDLDTYETTKILWGKGTLSLFIVNDKIISVYDSFIIRIWNLNDLKLLKEFEYVPYDWIRFSPIFSISADSKKLAAFTMIGGLAICDFTKELRRKYLKHL